jgi:Right handed beta helix region
MTVDAALPIEAGVASDVALVARDVASSNTGDSSADLPVASDLASSIDHSGASDLTADSPAPLDAPVDQAVSGVDAPTAETADAGSEAPPYTGPTTYYIATTGSDQAAGTLAAPFRTIQHCATLAQPGDSCMIRAGTYRETVTPARSGTSDAHITFAAYQGECVTVNGADVLTATWQPYQGSIYVADTSLRFIQLFAGGKMLNEARWPNADPDDLVHMPLAKAGPNTTETTLEGPTLPAGDWTGAYLFSIPGQRWVSYTRKIESYDQVKKLATWSLPMRESPAVPELEPRARDTYYVFGSLLALDSAGEWFQDPATGKLYLWAPGSVDPSTLKIEAKQRDYGFNLGARSYIDIMGVRLFATSIRMLGASHCVVDGVHARYLSHLRETTGYNTGMASGTWTPTSAGIVVNISNSGSSPLYVNIGGTDATWCVPLTTFDKPVFIPWESFNTSCYNNSGTYYARQPLVHVAVSVPGSNTPATPFNFCIKGMAAKLDGTGDSAIESPEWAIMAGGYVANSDWQGFAWISSGGTGTTMTPADFTTLTAGGPLCASGSVAATSDYSGYAMVGINLDYTEYASTAPVLGGDFNEWKNGSIVFAAAEGIVAAGNDNKISNNVVHDTSYMAVGSSGIATEGYTFPPTRNEISGNTLNRTGGMGITLDGTTAARVLNNRVSQAMQILDDGGLIYSWGTTAGGSEVAYNDLSDNQAIYGTGIYLDAGSSGFIVHHNLVRNTSWSGVSFKAVNQFFNNTILGTPMGAASEQGANDLSTAVFSNNLIEQRPGLFLTVVQKQTTDGAEYQAIIPVTNDWQKVTVPFSSLAQPNWGVRESFDPTNVTGLGWTVGTLGAYEIDIDDVWLEGTTPKLVDDFDAGSTNRLGGAWSGNGSGGSTATESTVVGYTGNAVALTGNNIREGVAGLGTFLSSGQGPVDVSAYTGISFRIRGTATLVLSNGTPSTTPVQAHNLDCPVDANGVPTSSCPVDQGGLFSPYTDGFTGTAPDVGAFESGITPWTAGSTTVEPSALCPE